MRKFEKYDQWRRISATEWLVLEFDTYSLQTCSFFLDESNLSPGL